MTKPFKSTATITVTTADTILAEVTLDGAEVLGFEILNAGATAFSEFRIQLQWHPDGTFRDEYGGADWVAPYDVGVIRVSSTNPATLAGGGNAHGKVDVRGACAARLIAKVASGTTTATASGSLTGGR